MRPNRIVVGLPMYTSVYSRFVESFLAVRGWSGTPVLTSVGVYLPDAHNRMVTQALSMPGWDYLLWVEQDMGLQPDTLERVSRYVDPVVGALYFAHSPPYFPMCFDRRDDVWAWWDAATVRRVLDHPGLYECDAVGMGCTAIHREVLEKWPKDVPYYKAEDRNAAHMSDDFWFCERVREIGHHVYVDTANRPKHMTVLEQDHAPFLLHADANGQRSLVSSEHRLVRVS